MTILLQRKELLKNVLGNKYGSSLYFHARSFGFLVPVDHEEYEYMFDKDKLEKHILKQCNHHEKIFGKIKSFKKKTKHSPYDVWNPWEVDGCMGKFFKKREGGDNYSIWVDINLFAALKNANPLDTRGYHVKFNKTAKTLQEANVPICPFSRPQLKKVAEITPILKRARRHQRGYERLLKRLREYTDELW